VKTIKRVPVAITVSRETGKIIEVQRAEVKPEDFRKTCQELLKITARERKEAEE